MARKSGPFIAFYPSDWLAGTRGLTAAETGVYITLLALMFERDGPIEHNPARLARFCGLPNAAFKRALDTLIDLGKIEVENGCLTNSRAQDEILRRQNRVNSATESARARWQKSEEKQGEAKSERIAGAMPEACETDANQNQNQKRDKTGGSVKPARTVYSAEFEAFWKAYPHRNGTPTKKKPAFAIWARLIKAGHDPAQITQAAIRYQSEKDVKRGYGRHAETWLRQEGFADEPAAQNLAPQQIEKQRQANAEKAILSGKAFLCTSITASMARALISQGRVTHEQCKAVGVSI